MDIFLKKRSLYLCGGCIAYASEIINNSNVKRKQGEQSPGSSKKSRINLIENSVNLDIEDEEDSTSPVNAVINLLKNGEI